MRTTLDIDNDVLLAAKELAIRQSTTAGDVLSQLARRALTAAPAATAKRSRAAATGFRPFAPRGKLVSNTQIDKLRNEAGV